MNRPREVIKKWVEAFNARDADWAAALYHHDAEILQVALGSPVIGKEAILRDLEAFFQATPDSVTNIENLFEDGDWAILEWSGGGTYQKSGANPRNYVLRGCGFFKIVEGKIKIQRGYWDKATWFKQVGLPIE